MAELPNPSKFPNVSVALSSSFSDSSDVKPFGIPLKSGGFSFSPAETEACPLLSGGRVGEAALDPLFEFPLDLST